jgi:Cof subfamily protein (haloacid dehalogenase superfamily)
LKNNGHTPIIASGRTPHLLYGVDKILGIESYICANGNYISYLGQVLYEHYVPKKVVKRLIAECEKLGIDLVLQGADAYVAHSKNTPLVDQFSDMFELEHPVIDRSYHLTHELLAFVVFDSRFVDHLRKEFPELLFNQSCRFGYDVNLKGDLKAEGIRWLVKYLHYPEDDVYAIGDGFNDISMIKAVKHGIAMGNGFPEVKAVASYVTSSVTEDGVSNALKYFHLI